MLLSQRRMGCSRRGQDLSRHGMRHALSPARPPGRISAQGWGAPSRGQRWGWQDMAVSVRDHQDAPTASLRPDPHLAPPSRAKTTRRVFPPCGHPGSGDAHRILATSPPKLSILLFFFFLQMSRGLFLPFQKTQAAAHKCCLPMAKQFPLASRGSPGSPGPQPPPAQGEHPVSGPRHGFALPCRRASTVPAPSSASCNTPAQTKMLSEPLGRGEQGWP